MIIDTHAHYDDSQFDEDRDQMLADFKQNHIEKGILATASVNSINRVMSYIDTYPNIYGMQGVHPDEVGGMTDDLLLQMEENCKHSKIVAIGEIGLDYHWNVEAKEIQKEWFTKQLELAIKTNLPVCIHSRDSAKDTFDILKEYSDKQVKGVIHCYSYSPEMAAEYVKMGYYIGIGGVVTFKNGKKCKDTVREIPLERIVLETDAPYLSPEPFRGKRNESSYLKYVADEIAAIKEISAEEVIRQTTINAYTIYPKLNN